MPIEREDLEFYFDQVHDKLNGINNRLDTLNGKTNKNVTDIAILYDRADQAKSIAATAVNDAKHSGRNHGATWGGIIGGAMIAIYQFFLR